MHAVKMACERPDDRGRSLSTWFCADIARQLENEGVVETISVSTVQRILASHKLKPWRTHMWLSPKTPRDAENKADLAAKLQQFLAEWNQQAHPFNWSTKSVAKVMADAPIALAA